MRGFPNQLDNLFVGLCGQLTASPIIPMAYPAATPARPTDRPDERCMKPLLVSVQFKTSICLQHIREQTGILIRRRLKGPGDENGNDEAIDCDNTGHNDRDKGLSVSVRPSIESLIRSQLESYLHDQVWSKCPHACNPNARLRGPICGTQRCDVSSHYIYLCHQSTYTRRSSKFVRGQLVGWRRWALTADAIPAFIVVSTAMDWIGMIGWMTYKREERGKLGGIFAIGHFDCRHAMWFVY